MQARAGVTAIALGAALALSGCGGGDTGLMNLRSSGGPDEFAIMPAKPLEMPESLSDLPGPTPGGSNRTDLRPLDDAIVALGGTPGAATGGIPSGDSVLYAHANRFGTEANIRATLAAEDVQWRRDNKGRVLERLFNVNVYYKAYRDQSLDQYAELARWRKTGIATPSAPPEPTK